MNIYSNTHVIAWNAFASGSVNKKKEKKEERKKKKKTGTNEVQTVVLVSAGETKARRMKIFTQPQERKNCSRDIQLFPTPQYTSVLHSAYQGQHLITSFLSQTPKLLSDFIQ